MLDHGAGQEVVREVEDVTLAMAERRQLQHHGREPMVQLAAEAAGPHRGCQVDAGGRDDPHVHRLVAGTAEPAYRPRFDRGQQLDLQGVGKLADLVEEQRAVMGRFDQSLLGGPGVGERSALETEELRLQEGVGNRCAVDIDERAGAASSAPVEQTGHQPFPRPRFPEEQDRGWRRPILGDPRQASDLPTQCVERSALADELGERKASGHFTPASAASARRCPKPTKSRPIGRIRSPEGE